KLEVFKKEIEAIEDQLRRQQGKLKQLEKDQYQMGISLAQLESSRQAVERELQDKYRMTIDEARYPLEASFEQTEKEIRFLREAV
ncbi:hypothetical protein ABTM44_18340, partial [Acinetobacter baumannii]